MASEMLAPGEDHSAFAIAPTLEGLCGCRPVALLLEIVPLGVEGAHLVRAVRGGRLRGELHGQKKVRAKKGGDVALIIRKGA